MMTAMFLLMLTGAVSGAPAPMATPVADEAQSREQALYTKGTAALDGRDWDEAARAFADAAALKGERADAALYWRAYALHKSGRRDLALQALATLKTTYPRSRWTKDARALDLEIRQASGQPPTPEAADTDDLKLMALGGLMNADPARALPIIKQMLAGTANDKVKERALFVLAQSGTPEARQLLLQVARSDQDPEAQAAAVRYLGLFGGDESRQALSEILSSGASLPARKAVLQALMLAGDRQQLAAIARKDPSPELRQEAIQQLGVLGARAELQQIYQQDTDVEARRAVINALFVSGAVDEMTALATKESDAGLRREAVQRLGLMGEKTAPTLKNIYANARDPETKRAVVQAFFVQGNATALVQLARQEQDASVKKDIVQMLSLMNSKEATDYMLELLK
jgi:tetratricopeptide (TPR) repeat protein